MNLFGHPDSGHAYKVALALHLSGIPYQYEWVDIWAPCESRPKEFRENSKWCEVPLLLMNGEAHIQSGAILQMLARDYGAMGGAGTLKSASEWIIWEANRIGMCLPQLLEAKRSSTSFPQGAVDWLEARLKVDLLRLDAEFRTFEFLGGKAPNIADIAVFGYAYKAFEAGIPLSSHVEGWIKRIMQLTNFQNAENLLAKA